MTSTITFPNGSDIQLIGDDAATTVLQWTGPESDLLCLSLHQISVCVTFVSGQGWEPVMESD